MDKKHGTEWEWPPGEPLTDLERQILSQNLVNGLAHLNLMVGEAKEHLQLQGGDCPKCCIGERVGEFIESLAQGSSDYGTAGLTLLLSLAIRTLAEQELEQ